MNKAFDLPNRSMRWSASAIAFSVSLYAYTVIRGAPIFPLCIAVPLVLFCLRPSLPQRIHLRPTSIAAFLYLAWPILISPASAFLAIQTFGPATVSKQLVSLAYFYVSAFPALLGYRLARYRGAELPSIIKGLYYALTANIVFVFAVFAAHFPDVYLSRAIIKQRLPLIIAFVGILLFVYGGRRNLRRMSLLPLLGFFAVAVSLSRASLLQLAASVAGFLLVYPSQFIRALWRRAHIISLLGAAVLCLLSLPSFASVREHLVSRVSGLLEPRDLTESDLSASVRVTIWQMLFQKVQQHPLGIAIGFNQLGPSFVGESFLDIEGELIAEYSAHNQYIDTYVRSGAIGVVLEALMLFAVIFQSLFTQNYVDSNQRQFARAVGIAMVGTVPFGMFHETLRWNLFGALFWFLVGWLIGAPLKPTPRTPASSGEKTAKFPL